MATCISTSPDDTLALGSRWGRNAQSGWLIGLSGDLGAGKTLLVKGLARGLEIIAPVRSPTFALLHTYPGGRLPLVHLDFYRLESPLQIHRAGLEDYLTCPSGVTVVEWIERWWNVTTTPQPDTPARRASPAHRAADACLSPAPPPRDLPPGVRYRHVRLECLTETTRRIVYEDFGP
ncbi:MAG: tRNA (adenosine(37)-N6)-threonylcarbamoyltransferase complex ATPase subunit type 1 TsaE [Verrucomicrobia bacterium]|nr:tRNA (adenosine(37)-N6)-threonylcarbamoyltransferase complex ATPase subunit type 1 TsaE [Verrucomicrobiota bacterium]